MTVFDNIRSRNELGHAFGQLDIYWAEVRGTDRDHPEIRAAVMQRCDEAVRNAPSSWSLSRVQNLTEPDDPRSRMEKSEYVHAWETLQAELAEQEIEDRLDTIDPLTLADEEAAYGELTDQGDWRKELEYDLNRDIRHEEWTAQLDRQDTPVTELPADDLEVLDPELVDDEPVDAVPADPDAVPSMTTPELEIDDTDLVVEPDPSGEVTEPELTELEPATEEAVVAEPELAAGDGTDDVTPPAVELTEPTVAEPELEVTEPDQWETDLDAPEPASTSWWGTSKQWPHDRAGDVTRWVGDRAAKAKLWVDELRSGKHRQSFGQWEQTGPFGCTKECTVQVGKNALGMDLAEMNATFGANFIGQAVVRNDRERRSFDEQADFIERTQLGDREPELER